MATPGQIVLLAVTEYRVERMLHGTRIAVIHKLGYSLVCNGLSVVGETDQHLPRLDPTVLASMAITKILDHLLTSRIPYGRNSRVVGFEGIQFEYLSSVMFMAVCPGMCWTSLCRARAA
jgi:hypothetical protein